MNFKVGDFLIKYNGGNYVLKVKSEDYISSSDICDLEIFITKEEIKKEISSNTITIPFMRAENNIIHRKIAEWLPLHGAFLLHSACFDVNGTGVAFAAHSGTGKTTHMRLWQQLLGDRLTIVNGDKPIVRFFDDEPETPYAYGTPWNGKERLGCNMRTPLKHICFIERAEQNSCEPMEKGDAVNLIFDQVYMPKNPAAMVQTLQLIDRLLSCCRLWKIKCNMEPQAAEVSFGVIFGKEPAASKI